MISPAEITAFFWCCLGALALAVLITIAGLIWGWWRVGQDLDMDAAERDLDPPKPDFKDRKAPNWINKP